MLINYSNIIDPPLKRIRIKMLESSAIKKDSVVLDVCCGTGDQCFYYAQKSDHVFGVDIDERMIGLVKKRKRAAVNNPQLIISDASNLPFKNDCFDLVSICLALHEKEEELRNKIISEIKRVVKKDGTIMIVDYSSPLPINIMSLLIKITEFIAGRAHFKCFNNYVKMGGMNKILEDNSLKINEETLFIQKTMRLVKVSK